MCHTTTYVQATGDLRGQAATGSTGPGRSHSLPFGGPVGQPGSLTPVTSATFAAPPECSAAKGHQGHQLPGALVPVPVPVRVWSGKRWHLMSRCSEQGALQLTSQHSLGTSQVALEPGRPLPGPQGAPLPWRGQRARSRRGWPPLETRLQPEQHQVFKQNHPRGGLLDPAPLPHSLKTAAATARPGSQTPAPRT